MGVPKCPFRVNLYSRLGDHLRMEHHNYETLPGAMSYRDALLTRPRTTRVEVLMVLDESTPLMVLDESTPTQVKMIKDSAS